MDLSIHHIGIVVRDIESARTGYELMGYHVETPIVHDPDQTAYVQFLRLPGNEVYVELVAPDSADSKLANALAKGGGINHICYAVTDIDDACRFLREAGMYVVQEPISAVAFGGRQIAWFVGRDRTIMELVERGGPGEL